MERILTLYDTPCRKTRRFIYLDIVLLIHLFKWLSKIPLGSDYSFSIFQHCSFINFYPVIRITSTDVIEIPAVGSEIQPIAAEIPRIALKVYRPCQLRDHTRGYRDSIPRRDIVFRTEVYVAKYERRQSWYRIVEMGNSEVAALVLVRDIIAHGSASNPWLPVCIQICWGTRVPEFGGCNGCDSTSEAVTCHHHFERWVGRCCRF